VTRSLECLSTVWKMAPSLRATANARLVIGLPPVIAAFALLAAGCGSGGGSPGVASVASSTAATTTHGTEQGEMVAFSRCMRAHGVPSFPDPQHFVGGNVKLTVHAYGPTNPQVQSAMNACNQLLPDTTSSGPPLTAADRTDYLEAAACMRRHGIPNFPDPTFQDNSVQLNTSVLDKNSPLDVRAVTICRKLIPPGLPYND
jgi:hypothetical protein